MKVTQSCLTLYDPMDYTVHRILQARVLELGSLLQGIFPTQGSNLGLPHCRWILYCLSLQGPKNTGEGKPIPSPGDHPNPGIKLGSPALQVDSLPAQLPGKPNFISDCSFCSLWKNVHKYSTKTFKTEIQISSRG